MTLANKITPRQLELLCLYCSGYDYEQIAQMKFLSYNTVRRDLKIAVENIGVKNIVQLALVCLEAGLIRRHAKLEYRPVVDERSIH